MFDRSIAGPEASERIHEILDNQRRYKKDKPVYMISRDENKVILAIADSEHGIVTTYPLDWDTACFIGYCLFVESLQFVHLVDVVNYIESLAKRRDEIIEWFDMCKKYLAGFKR